MDSLDTIIGLAAAAGTTGAYVPQVVKSWRTRSTRDLSPHLLIILATGLALWIVYGILRGDFVVILANVLTLGLVATLLYLKFWAHVDRSIPPQER